jgi:hypothetical protein
VHVPSNWFESFFHGVAVDLWVNAIPPEHTKEEAARGRLDIEYTFVSHAGIEVRRGTHRAYTFRQLVELVAAAGFDVTAEPGWPANPTLAITAIRR